MRICNVRSLICGLVLVLGVSARVEAAPISLTVPFNQFLAGGPHVFAFDLTPQLVSLGPGYNAPYEFTSALVSFQFEDAGGFTSETLASVYQYTSGPYCCQTWRRSVTTYFTDTYEAAAVDFGDQTLAGNTSFYSTSAFGGTTYDGFISDCTGALSGCGYYTDHWQKISGYNGSFALATSLSGTSLADLAADGVLGFSVNVTNSLRLVSATITADVQPTAVSEPASLVLLGAGLCALSGRIRKRGRAACVSRTVEPTTTL